MIPCLQLKFGDRTVAVVVRNLHSTSVSLVVNDLGPSVPLFLLTELLEHVVGAHLHDAELLVLACSVALAIGALT